MLFLFIFLLTVDWVLGFFEILGLIEVTKFILIMRKFMITFFLLGFRVVNHILSCQKELCSWDVLSICMQVMEF